MRSRAISTALAMFVTALVPIFAAGCARASTTTLTGKDRLAVDNGTAWVQNNEQIGTSSYSITNTHDRANFTITKYSFNQSGIAGFPSVYVGCHFGLSHCTSNNPFPLQLSAIKQGEVPVSTKTVTPASVTGKWNDFFDIFFNQKWPPTTWGRSGGLEMGIRLTENNYGNGGTQIASNVAIDGYVFNVFWNAPLHILGFRPTTNISNPSFSGDLYPFIQFALAHGQLQPSWYLIDVEQGFELQAGNAVGLGVSSFNVAGRGDPVTQSDTTPPSTPTGLAASNP